MSTELKPIPFSDGLRRLLRRADCSPHDINCVREQANRQSLPYRYWPACNCSKAADLALGEEAIERLQQAEWDSERTIGWVGAAITSADGDMLWTDRAVSQIVANATRELREALRPFANYACDPPDDCHNCRARTVLQSAQPPAESKAATEPVLPNDTQRLDWLAQHEAEVRADDARGGRFEWHVWQREVGEWVSADSLRAAIDAAMQQPPAGEGK